MNFATHGASYNLDNFRFKSINITSFTHGGAISLVKLLKVSQIRENSPWFTLFAIHFYSNLYHSVVPGSDFRIYNLASLFTPREAISSLLLDQWVKRGNGTDRRNRNGGTGKAETE